MLVRLLAEDDLVLVKDIIHIAEALDVKVSVDAAVRLQDAVANEVCTKHTLLVGIELVEVLRVPGLTIALSIWVGVCGLCIENLPTYI